MDRTQESYLKFPSEPAEAAWVSHSARVKKAKEAWDALKNELTAIMNTHVGRGNRERGWCEASLEDADVSVLMLLDECQRTVTKDYAIEE